MIKRIGIGLVVALLLWPWAITLLVTWIIYGDTSRNPHAFMDDLMEYWMPL